MDIVANKMSVLHLKNRSKIIEKSHPFYFKLLSKPLVELASSLSAKIFFIDSDLIPELAQHPSYLFSYDLNGYVYADVVLNITTLKNTQKWLQSDVRTLLDVALAHEIGHLIARLDDGDQTENRAWLEALKLLKKYQLCDRSILERVICKTIEWWNLEKY